MEEDQPAALPDILTVEASYRIRLPQPLCRRVGWIAGEQPVDAWVLMGASDRCRFLSATEADADLDIQQLQARIAEELDARSTGALEFQNGASVALTFRLTQVQLKRHETSGWRLTLPRHIAAIMQLHPQESSLAALFVQGHIELWTIEALRSFSNIPLPNLL